MAGHPGRKMPVAPSMTTIGTLVDGSAIFDLHLYVERQVYELNCILDFF